MLARMHASSYHYFYVTSSLTPQHGADVNRKNRDGHTALDLVKESDQDVADLLRGDAALLDAAKKGNLARVQKLLNPDNINCRDSQVRCWHVGGRYWLAGSKCLCMYE